MITIARRAMFGVLGLAALNPLNSPARAQQLVPARRPDDIAPESIGVSVPPGPIVSGTYELLHQEGYAVALLAVGFSQDMLLQHFQVGPKRITISTVPNAMFFKFDSDFESRVALNSPLAINVAGAHIPDWLARFDLPSRQIISFTAPDGRRIQSTQTFSPDGYLSVLAIDGAPEFKSVRIWKRVIETPDVRRQPKGVLVPL